MTAIFGLAYLLQQTTLDTRQRDFVSKLEASAQSLMRILEEMLGGSSTDSSRMGLDPDVLGGTGSAKPLGRGAHLGGRRLLGGLRVLLVEDDPMCRVVARGILEGAGANVIEAGDGAEAVRLAREHAAGLDAVLMDIHLLRLDGDRATAAIREDPGMRAIPVFALTASAQVSDHQMCLAAGMNEVLTKPLNPESLALALQRVAGPRRRTARPKGPAAVGAGSIGSPEPTGASATWRAAGNRTWLELLADAHGGDGETIGAAIKAGELGRAASLAHALSGAAATLGAPLVAAAAINLERRLRSGVGESLEGLTAALAAALDHLRSTAANSAAHSPDPLPPPGPRVPTEPVAELFRELHHRLSGQHLGARATVSLLQQHPDSAMYEPELSVVSADIDGLRFAEARAGLAGLARRLGVGPESGP